MSLILNGIAGGRWAWVLLSLTVHAALIGGLWPVDFVRERLFPQTQTPAAAASIQFDFASPAPRPIPEPFPEPLEALRVSIEVTPIPEVNLLETEEVFPPVETDSPPTPDREKEPGDDLESPNPPRLPGRHVHARTGWSPVHPKKPEPQAADTETSEPRLPATSSQTTGPPRAAVARADNPHPRYPRRARRLGQEGVAWIRVHVAANGEATKVELIESSGHRDLDDAAISSLRLWKFDPATEAGRPIPDVVELPVRFELR